MHINIINLQFVSFQTKFKDLNNLTPFPTHNVIKEFFKVHFMGTTSQ